MKKSLIALVAVCIAAASLASSALAWHADGVNVSATCNTTTGKFDVAATIIQNAQYPATLKSVSPTTINPNVASTAVVVVVKFTNGETQTFTKTVATGACFIPPPRQNCPAGTTQDASSTSTILVCVKTVTITNTVSVDRPVPGPTVYVDKPVPGPTVYVDKPVPGPTKIVVKKVPGKTKVITKVVTKTRVKTVTKPKLCPVPQIGVHTGKHPGVEGAG